MIGLRDISQKHEGAKVPYTLSNRELQMRLAYHCVPIREFRRQWDTTAINTFTEKEGGSIVEATENVKEAAKLLSIAIKERTGYWGGKYTVSDTFLDVSNVQAILEHNPELYKNLKGSLQRDPPFLHRLPHMRRLLVWTYPLHSLISVTLCDI